MKFVTLIFLLLFFSSRSYASEICFSNAKIIQHPNANLTRISELNFYVERLSLQRIHLSLANLMYEIGIQHQHIASQFQDAFQSSHKNIQAILLDEFAPLRPHSEVRFHIPNISHLFQSALKTEEALVTTARLLQRSRSLLKANKPSLFSINIDAMDLKNIKHLDIDVNQEGSTLIARTQPFVHLESSDFKKFHLKTIAGTKVGTIGIGGGSDGIQAAMLAKMLQKRGKTVPFVISVRTSETGSAISGGVAGEHRSIVNHGGVVTEGVYIITPETTGSGRFLENLPAHDFRSYLVLDSQDGTLPSRLQAAIDHAGGADSIVGLDTGGDALYSAVSVEGAKATPDQDLRVLQALGELPAKQRVYLAIAATGVDSPTNTSEILKARKAIYFKLTVDDREMVQKTYHAWNLDGSDDQKYGKTPLAWQLALAEKYGLQVLNLPTSVVIDHKNPWFTFVNIKESMQGIFFLDVK